jgi:hypothetical protein
LGSGGRGGHARIGREHAEVRAPAEALEIRRLVATYDFDRMRSFGFLYVETAYWLTVRQGIFRCSETTGPRPGLAGGETPRGRPAVVAPTTR